MNALSADLALSTVYPRVLVQSSVHGGKLSLRQAVIPRSGNY